MFQRMAKRIIILIEESSSSSNSTRTMNRFLHMKMMNPIIKGLS